LTFRYPGSLTTPPCSEDVSWLLMVEPVGISAAQLDRFSEIIEDNNRPIQPLNDRDVAEDVTP
jgi:carbonic anhydrase